MNNIDEYLDSLPVWQKHNLDLFRKLIHDIVPAVEEGWKWNVPVFLIDGKMIFTMAAFKEHTKYNFIANGALIADPKNLFNNGLESKKSRGIDLKEGQIIDESDLKALIETAIAG